VLVVLVVLVVGVLSVEGSRGPGGCLSIMCDVLGGRGKVMGELEEGGHVPAGSVKWGLSLPSATSRI
jgi:hypothetical protein